MTIAWLYWRVFLVAHFNKRNRQEQTILSSCKFGAVNDFLLYVPHLFPFISFCFVMNCFSHNSLTTNKHTYTRLLHLRENTHTHTHTHHTKYSKVHITYTVTIFHGTKLFWGSKNSSQSYPYGYSAPINTKSSMNNNISIPLILFYSQQCTEMAYHFFVIICWVKVHLLSQSQREATVVLHNALSRIPGLSTDPFSIDLISCSFT